MQVVLRGFASKKPTADLERELQSLTADAPGDLLHSLLTVYGYLDGLKLGFLSTDIVQLRMSQLSQRLRETGNLLDSGKSLMAAMNEKIFRLPDAGIPDPHLENQRNLFERQLTLESESYAMMAEDTVQLNRTLVELNMHTNRGGFQRLIANYYQGLTALVADEQQRLVTLTEGGARRSEFVKAFVSFDAGQLTMIGLVQLFNALLSSIYEVHRESDDGKVVNQIFVGVTLLSHRIAVAFSRELFFQKTMEEKKRESKSPEYLRVCAENTKKLSRVMPEMQLQHHTAEVSMNAKLQMAETIVYLMKLFLKFTDQEGRTHMLLQSSKVRRRSGFENVLVVSEHFNKLFVDELAEMRGYSYLDRSLPLVYPPAPWQDPKLGGYYLLPTLSVKISESASEYQRLRGVDLRRVLSIMDYIGGVAWCVDPFALRIADAVWAAGGGKAGIPRRHDAASESSSPAFAFHLRESGSRAQQDLKRQIQNRFDLISLRADFLLKYQVAHAFAKVGRIYFPHQLDFRGRAYPIPPHLNHMGADFSRGTLVFSERRPITRRGLWWLKVHLANKLGRDKLSFDDRVAYVEDQLPVLRRCVEDPMRHDDWMQTEDCWQSLVAMKELFCALESDFPEDYASGLPIHLDGSFNGLQHYAALGRDEEGAFEVNIIDRPTPGDLYTRVAKAVGELIAADAEDALSPTQQLSATLRPHIKRKTVKQTVMTTVYGVTFIGALRQIERQLRAQAIFSRESDYTPAAKYVATLTMKAVENLFSKAHRIRQWLMASARLVVRHNAPVSWVSPLGFPISQSYFRDPVARGVALFTQRVHAAPGEEEVNPHRQVTAFPPNFIHNLDSTHMLLTAERMRDAGLVFASVHDSFWTHPGDVDHMARLLREEFVRLHSMPVLENLKESFEKRFPEETFPPLPGKGGLALERVLDSRYFFS